MEIDKGARYFKTLAATETKSIIGKIWAMLVPIKWHIHSHIFTSSITRKGGGLDDKKPKILTLHFLSWHMHMVDR